MNLVGQRTDPGRDAPYPVGRRRRRDNRVQFVQIVGALLILTGFIGAQANKLSPQSVPYLILNLTGSAILTVLGYIEHQWGFVLLEGVWTLVSGYGLWRAFAVRNAQG
jgi:hypothetical protein